MTSQIFLLDLGVIAILYQVPPSPPPPPDTFHWLSSQTKSFLSLNLSDLSLKILQQPQLPLVGIDFAETDLTRIVQITQYPLSKPLASFSGFVISSLWILYDGFLLNPIHTRLFWLV